MNEYVVKLVVDSSGVARGVRSAKGEVVEFERGLDRAGQSGGRFSSAMGTAFGVTLAGAAATAAASIVSVGAALAKLGADLGETDSKFASVFGDATASMDAFLDGFANKAGLTRGQARALAADVGSIGKGAGLAGKDLSDFGEQITRAAG